MKHTRLFAGLSVAILAAAVAGPVAAQSPSAPAAGGQYVIGVSNTTIGNGWRDEMICSIKAQALVSGQVASLNIQSRNTDATGQLEDIRNLISAGVDAIIINPVDPNAINDAIKEATDAGIKVVTVDQGVTEPSAYLMSNDQEAYAYMGAKWLFEHLNGKGAVVYMGGVAGTGADSDRKAGFERARAEFPDITVAAETQTDWQFPKGKQQMLDLLASGLQIDGVWTSGIDYTITEAFQEAGQPIPPIVGADGSEFVQQLVTIPDFTGALVTNPASVGGAGVTLALKLLNGETAEPVTKFTPVLFENATDEGKAALAAAADPSVPKTWPIGIFVPDWTTYTKEQILPGTGCKGPGE